MTFESPHSKKTIKGDGLLSDLFNTSVKLIKDNKENLTSIISESSKLKDSVSKNIELTKKINKLDEFKKHKLNHKPNHKPKQELKEEPKQELKSPPSKNKEEIINTIVSKKKGRGFYDIHN